MSRILVAVAVVAALAHAADAPALESTRALAAALAKSGRAEATLYMPRPVMTIDPGSSARATTRATLALELPDRARMDIPATGERITLRSDGGEWLQPQQQQVVTLTAQHAAAASRWWKLLSSGAGAQETRLGDRHYRLRLDADADSAEIWLDARGLPARLEFSAVAGLPGQYRIASWHFMRARGVAAFRQAIPPGYETVAMP